MTLSEPNQVTRRSIGLSTVLILSSAQGEALCARLNLVGLIIIGVGVTGPA
jgi:hypothetical protein